MGDDDEQRTVLTESPSYIKGGKLREYQIQGLNWLISLYENRLSGILADEMGLGKTLQTISFLGYLRYIKHIDGPFIVIVPKSTLDNWRREFQKWTPDVNVLVLQGNKEERQKLIKSRLLTAKFDVLVTSFEMVIRRKHSLRSSGGRTPLQNNLHELWALLNFLLPDVFGDSNVFDEWFNSQEETEGADQDKVVQQLHKVLSPFLLRRVKADVENLFYPRSKQTFILV
ncbi:ISWI chromatin-remodeling complex ATPase ISW2 [Candidozyma auris]|nr:ISWI chromatin-remodeling complex ATPase ISW2 [[Candida] auris]